MVHWNTVIFDARNCKKSKDTSRLLVHCKIPAIGWEAMICACAGLVGLVSILCFGAPVIQDVKSLIMSVVPMREMYKSDDPDALPIIIRGFL